MASASVRSSATQESVQIFKDLMQEYRGGILEEDLVFTQNALIKSNAREFETLRSLIGMLQTISIYNMPKDYVKGEEETVRNMTLDIHRNLAVKYIDPGKMYYVVAGDAATQMQALAEVGFGEPILYEE